MKLAKNVEQFSWNVTLAKDGEFLHYATLKLALFLWFILMFFRIQQTYSAPGGEEMFYIILLWLFNALIREVLTLLFLIIYFFLSITRIDHNCSLLKYPAERSTTLVFDRTILLCCIALIFHLYQKMESGVSGIWSVKYQSLFKFI